MSMLLTNEAGSTFVEGPAGEALMTRPEDATAIIEACFGHGTHNVLLHAENMTPGFFDLSSREAGLILQRLRNYGIRLVVVCPPGTRFSSRFGEMVAEERQGRHFAIVDTRGAALEWLGR
jgi:Domain of unknown function (DUF4180)